MLEILKSIWQATKEVSLITGAVLLGLTLIIIPVPIAAWIVKSSIPQAYEGVQLIIGIILIVLMWGIPFRTMDIMHQKRERNNVRNS